MIHRDARAHNDGVEPGHGAERRLHDRLQHDRELIQDLIRRCILEEEAVGLTEEELAERIITGEFLS